MSEEANQNLDQILNQSTETLDLNPPEPEAQGSAEQPEGNPEAQPKPETGDKQDQDGTPPPEGTEEGKKAEADPQEAFKKAAIDERRKRQAFEQQIAQLQREIQTLKQSEQKRPDMFEDPEGYQAWQDQQRQSEMTQMRLAMSESMFRDTLEQQGKADEFEEAGEYFRAEAQRNPALIQEMLNHPNPAKFVYQSGMRFKAIEEIGDPASYRARIEQETEARLLPKLDELVNAKLQEALSQRLPKSLAGVQSSGERNPQAPVDDGHVPLSAILGEK